MLYIDLSLHSLWRCLTLVSLILGSLALAASDASTLKVATLNIRGAPPDQSNKPPANLRIDDEYPWSYRKGPLVRQVLQEHVDIIGFNEVRGVQLDDLVQGLRGSYDYVAHAADSTRNVSNPVFWRRSKLDLVKAHYFWLSKTPDVQSKGWDASMYKIATMAELRISSTKEIVYFTSTQLDSNSRRARIESADLLLKELIPKSKEKEDGKRPLTILAGDMNSPPTQEAYEILTGRRYIPGNDAQVPDTGFLDLRQLAGKDVNADTYHGFWWNSTAGNIDHIYAADNGVIAKRWRVTDSAVVSDHAKAGKISLRISDHSMVTVTLTQVS